MTIISICTLTATGFLVGFAITYTLLRFEARRNDRQRQMLVDSINRDEWRGRR